MHVLEQSENSLRSLTAPSEYSDYSEYSDFLEGAPQISMFSDAKVPYEHHNIAYYDKFVNFSEVQKFAKTQVKVPKIAFLTRF